MKQKVKRMNEKLGEQAMMEQPLSLEMLGRQWKRMTVIFDELEAAEEKHGGFCDDVMSCNWSLKDVQGALKVRRELLKKYEAQGRLGGVEVLLCEAFEAWEAYLLG